jgi:hypothetical protein
MPRSDRYSCARTVLEGLGGVGKTQIALEAAFRIRHSNPDCSVFWVPAIDVGTFENAYRRIGQALGISKNTEDEGDVKMAVKKALSQSDDNWLLIIDNADDVQLLFERARLFKYLPSNPRGSILITSRTHQVACKLDVWKDNVIPVLAMGELEAKQLLLKYLSKESRSKLAMQRARKIC